MRCPHYENCKFAQDTSVCNALGEEKYFELCPTFEEILKNQE